MQRVPQSLDGVRPCGSRQRAPQGESSAGDILTPTLIAISEHVMRRHDFALIHSRFVDPSHKTPPLSAHGCHMYDRVKSNLPAFHLICILDPRLKWYSRHLKVLFTTLFPMNSSIPPTHCISHPNILKCTYKSESYDFILRYFIRPIPPFHKDHTLIPKSKDMYTAVFHYSS